MLVHGNFNNLELDSVNTSIDLKACDISNPTECLHNDEIIRLN